MTKQRDVTFVFTLSAEGGDLKADRLLHAALEELHFRLRSGWINALFGTADEGTLELQLGAVTARWSTSSYETQPPPHHGLPRGAI